MAALGTKNAAEPASGCEGGGKSRAGKARLGEGSAVPELSHLSHWQAGQVLSLVIIPLAHGIL